MYAFAWFASSYVAGLVGRRCARRGRVPTASSAADGAPWPLRPDNDLRCAGAGVATVIVTAMWCTTLANGGGEANASQRVVTLGETQRDTKSTNACFNPALLLVSNDGSLVEYNATLSRCWRNQAEDYAVQE